MKKKLIIFTDVGDTIVDEESQLFEDGGYVAEANLIEGAKDAYQYLVDAGYTIAMVADGEVASFGNVTRQHQIEHFFTTKTISEEVGVCKPDRRMFDDAMQKLGLTEEDKWRIVMIGNNLKKDILGANQYGITSIWLSWSPRYMLAPETAGEVPDYVVATPAEIPALIDHLEEQLESMERCACAMAEKHA